MLDILLAFFGAKCIGRLEGTMFALIFVGLIFHENLKKATFAILFLLLPKIFV